ncbi:MAG: cell division protein FtsQ/DivIB [Hyphomicrobiales bacterium]|nr:cell division protein FtsQ/DivIB [Hyphomicrobiales bacterium]
MVPRRGVAGSRRAVRKPFLARFVFLSDRTARKFARFSGGLTGAGLRRAALLACFVFYGLTGLYTAVLNGAFDSSAAFAGTAYRSLAGVTHLTIGRIEVDGVKSGRRDEVMAALGVEPGQSILWFDTHRARARIETLRWVKQATVLRLLPDVVKVSIEERRPYAVWQRGGALSVIDEEGRVISDASGADYATLPLVVGFGANVEARPFFALLQRWPSLVARMRASVRVADRRWNIRLLNGLDIRLPEKNVAAAIDELAAIDEAYGLLQRDIAGIDLRLADRLTIRLTDEAATRRQAAIKEREKALGKKKGADT